MKKYLAVVEKAEGNYSAYLPDVDGCVAMGNTVEETLRLLTEALASHFELMVEEGYDIPEPLTVADFVEVNVPIQTKPAAARSRARKKIAARR
jgi:predicted RNase H-like HicB family nuclease